MQRIFIKTAFRTLITGLSGLGHGEPVTFLLVICGERKESISPQQSILQFNRYILNLFSNHFLLSLIRPELDERDPICFVRMITKGLKT